jgi:putative hydrolase of the HAD superfamily
MLINENQIKVIGFDADDTLWVNEPYYQETESIFCELLANYGSAEEVSAKLLETEHRNLPSYGYGTKGFMLSMVETAIQISDHQVSSETLMEIIQLGQTQLCHPVELLDGVEETMKNLHEAEHTLILATKGDLVDQERKLKESGLEAYFHHVEIMSHKTPEYYERLLAHLDISADAFLMVGNSVKSDILPVLELGGQAVHVPYHTTWALEQVEAPAHLQNFVTLSRLDELLELIP